MHQPKHYPHENQLRGRLQNKSQNSMRIQMNHDKLSGTTPYNPSPKTSEIVLDDIVLEWMESRKVDWHASA